MKTTPILFSTEMVQAILAGNKTQTRRVAKLPDCDHEKFMEADWRNDPSDYMPSTDNPEYFYCGLCGNGVGYANKFEGIKNPYGKPGDILWVRETWAELKNGHNEVWTEYKADGRPSEGEWKWKPSIFMHKAACRLFLKIKSVRVERLNDISEADAIAEGIENFLVNTDCNPPIYRNYMATYKDFLEDHYSHCANNAEHSYETLWQKINGSDSWDKNPFVWVVEFEKTDKPEAFLD